MANLTCLRCGLPLRNADASASMHESWFPGQGERADEVSFGCLFHVSSQMALCTHASSLEGANFDIPDNPVLVGPDTASIIRKDEVAWIPFRTPGRVQLLAHRLSPILPAAELLWSWFKHLLLALEALHAMGFAHGHVEKNMIWVDSPSPGEISRVNQVRLATPFLTKLPPDALECAQNEDVRNLALLFLEPLQTIETWHKGLDEFRELCAVLAQDPGQRARILPRVAEAHRMAQLVVEPLPAKNDFSQWKKPVLLFSGLFVLSLLVAWFFAGSGKKSTPAPSLPPRKRPNPPAEAVVEASKLRWDADFPIHRVPLDDDVLLYLAPDHEFWKNALRFLSFAGITLPRPPDSGAENFYSLQLDKTSWKARARLIMRRQAPEQPESSKVTSSAPAPVWMPLAGKGFPLAPDAISPPPVLLTEPGELLTETGYDPENTEQERLVLILRPPAGQARPGTLWSDWFGGILPSYCVLRIGRMQELRAAFSFERAADARDAARFLENVWKLAGLSTRDLVDVQDRRVRIIVPLRLLLSLPGISETGENSDSAAKTSDVPQPPAGPSSPEPVEPGNPEGHPDTPADSAPVRAPREFLPIPEL